MRLSERTCKVMLGGILALASFLRFWRLGTVLLIGDEAYYWQWSRHLAPSYYDHPAGVALVVRLSTLIGSESEAGIRWLNALLGLGCVLGTWLLGARLFSQRAGLVAATSVAVSAPYIVISRHVYTDAPYLFFLLLDLLLTAPLFTSREPLSWSRGIAIGLCTAVLFNTKYSAYPFAATLLFVISWQRPDLWRNRAVWITLAIALCGLIPTMLWNAQRDWVSFRWQLSHFGKGALHHSSFIERVGHTLNYVTPPVAALALPGLGAIRQRRGWTLLLPALVLIVPVILSPANSPRNLAGGFVLLLILGANILLPPEEEPSGNLRPALVSILLLSMTLYGVGTIIATQRETPLPQSDVAGAIRRDAAGWREAKTLALDPQAVLFALDYSLAGQLTYYTGREAYTSWGQYCLWGIPQPDPVVLVSLPYVEPDIVSRRLAQSYAEVEPRQEWLLSDDKRIWVWRASGLHIDTATFLERFDLLSLIQAAED